MTERDKLIINKIKDHVRSLDTPENKIFQYNRTIIQACFAEAINIIEQTPVSPSPTTRKSKDDILKELTDIMPFKLNKRIIPYIKEAMDIYANQTPKQVHDDEITIILLEFQASIHLPWNQRQEKRAETIKALRNLLTK